MMVDNITIFIKAGNGGDGYVSFRREKFVAAGGPDGGNGGRGGNIIFRVNSGLRTLVDFRYKKEFMAQDGERGKKNNMTGKNGEDLIINVPPGTVVKDAETKKAVLDMSQGEALVLKGGAGGKGNAAFATPKRQAPHFATPGKKTEVKKVLLELKSIADVGLIGFPNVGKSTILSVLTSAKPKVAAYPFTTIRPNLGVVKVHETSFVMADIPGLIEGASRGAGLGYDFLRHIERTRLLVHVLDASQAEGRDVKQDYEKIRGELAAYSQELARRPEIICMNKMDIPAAQENAAQAQRYFEGKGKQVYLVSAVTRTGLQALADAVATIIADLPPLPAQVREEGVIKEWNAKKPLGEFEVKETSGVYEVNGSLVDSIFERIYPDDPASMRHFQKLLVDFGIIDELKRAGAKDGDTILLNGVAFEFTD